MATSQIPKFEFLQTIQSKANSKNSENLIAHNSMIHYVNSWSRDKTVAYYYCSKRKLTGCTVTAIVNKLVIEKEDSVPPTEETRFIVNKCAPLDAHNHEGDVAGILSERILLEMAQKVEVSNVILVL